MGKLKKWLKKKKKQVKNAVSDAGNWAADKAGDVVDNVTEATADVYNTAIDATGVGLGKVVGLVDKEAGEKLEKFLDNVGDEVHDGIKSVGDTVDKTLDDAGKKFHDAIAPWNEDVFKNRELKNDYELARAFGEVVSGFKDDLHFYAKCAACADFVKRPAKLDVNSGKLISVDNVHIRSSTKNSALQARSNVMSFLREVDNFATIAKNAGFSPPDNPFIEIVRLTTNNREGRRTSQASQDDTDILRKSATDLVFNIKAYVNLIEASNKGAIDFGQGVFNAAQLDQISLSYSGLGGSGDTAVDLMNLLPNSDDIKEKRAKEALAVLDFTKRVPNVIFTAEYNPNENKTAGGCLIGWKRMNDASGYTIHRHSIFANEDTLYEIEDEVADEYAKKYLNYATSYVLTFYDTIRPKSVVMYLDEEVDQDEYYIYRVQAWQKRKENFTTLFPKDFVSVIFTQAQKNDAYAKLEGASFMQSYGSRKNRDATVRKMDLSAWPVLSEIIYGDSQYDWLLAAANIRASIDRKDTKIVTRKFSYLNADLSFLLSQMDAGNFVKPKNIDDVKNNIENCIKDYGIVQAIESVMLETGILYYFDARDAQDDTKFDRAGTNVNTSNIIGLIASAIDIENVVIDLNILSTSLAKLLGNKGMLNISTKLNEPRYDSSPTEVSIIDPDFKTDEMAETGIQFIAKFDDTSDNIADLTTYDGMSKIVRVIRIMSDYGEDRIVVNDDRNYDNEIKALEDELSEINRMLAADNFSSASFSKDEILNVKESLEDEIKELKSRNPRSVTRQTQQDMSTDQSPVVRRS